MTAIKMCGLSRECDIKAVNQIKPEYIGFVFFGKSRRYISPEKALELKQLLDKNIKAVGVFVDESVEKVAELLESGVIDVAQLHGHETEEYIYHLREMTKKPVIQAFRIHSHDDAEKAVRSTADMILLDAGADPLARDHDMVIPFEHAQKNQKIINTREYLRLEAESR